MYGFLQNELTKRKIIEKPIIPVKEFKLNRKRQDEHLSLFFVIKILNSNGVINWKIRATKNYKRKNQNKYKKISEANK